MDRPIEFRAWDKPNQKIMSKIFLNPNGDIGISCRKEFIIWQNPKYFELMQFIGKTDSKNQKIFEGDILQYSFKMDDHGEAETHLGEVYYCEENAIWLFDRSFEWSFIDGPIIDSSIEVIGNIFETKK